MKAVLDHQTVKLFGAWGFYEILAGSDQSNELIFEIVCTVCIVEM